jgi:hypothetical protein
VIKEERRERADRIGGRGSRDGASDDREASNSCNGIDFAGNIGEVVRDMTLSMSSLSSLRRSLSPS